MRWIGSVSLALALLLGCAVAACAARPATLTGTLTGARLPAAGHGRVPVKAIRLADGRVLAGTYATPRGRFTLKAPAGSYAVVASVIPERGARPPVERVAAFVAAKAGKRVAVRALRARRRGAGGRRGRARQQVVARAAFQHVRYLALWVRRWRVPGGDLRVFERGMTDMLITDLTAVVGRCGGAVVDRDMWDVLLTEQRLQQSPAFDPSTRVQQGLLIVPNATVSGTMTVSGSTMTLTARFHDERTGRRGTATVSGPADYVFDLEQELVGKLERLICNETPRTYEGTFSGTATSRLNQYTITWSGSVEIELQEEHGAPPSDWPAGDYAQYVVRHGSAHVKLDGTRGVCAAHGETDIDLAATTPVPPGIPGFSGPGVPSLPRLPVAGVQVDAQADEEPWFSLNVPAPATAAVPYQETGFGCQTDPEYPLTGLAFAYTPTPVRTTGGVLTGSPAWDPPGGFSHLQFGFSLRRTG